MITRLSRIIFVNRFFYPDESATSRLLTDLSFQLAGRGREVMIITSRLRYDNPAASLLGEETIQGVHVIRVPTSRFGRRSMVGRAVDYFSFYAAATWVLWKRLRRVDVVVVKTDPPLLSVPIGLVTAMRGAKLVNWLQDIFPEIASRAGFFWARGLFGEFLAAVRDASLRKACVNVVVGHRLGEYLGTRRISKSQIVVIENWADGTTIAPISSNPLRGEWGLATKFVVGYSGNMGRVHEFMTILDAADQLRKHNSIVFLFVGDGKWRQWIESESQRRELRNIVLKQYQPREKLSQALSVPDVHLVSLRAAFEGLVVPSTFYGIAAAGRPTIFIGDPNGEIARLIGQNRCGFAICEGASKELATTILSLAHDPRLTRELGANARSAFEACWDRNRACAAWARLLEDVA